MENNLKFNSVICTSRSQSERLLALGLKKETADMLIMSLSSDNDIIALPWVESGGWTRDNSIPAWSLHRLLSLLPRNVRIGKNYYDLVIVQNEFIRLADDLGDTYKYFDKEELYEGLLDCIEWLIKQGYFNKEYLV